MKYLVVTGLLSGRTINIVPGDARKDFGVTRFDPLARALEETIPLYVSTFAQVAIRTSRERRVMLRFAFLSLVRAKKTTGF